MCLEFEVGVNYKVVDLLIIFPTNFERTKDKFSNKSYENFIENCFQFERVFNFQNFYDLIFFLGGFRGY